MTATHVNGIAVIADEPAPSQITSRGGEQVYFKQIRSLLLEDGNLTYGCAHCDYTADSPTSVRPHLGKHTTKRAERRAENATELDPQTATIAELLTQVGRFNDVLQDRDRWKARAEKAEQDLATIQRAIRNATSRS